jgi:hypothetical protein
MGGQQVVSWITASRLRRWLLLETGTDSGFGLVGGFSAERRVRLVRDREVEVMRFEYDFKWHGMVMVTGRQISRRGVKLRICLSSPLAVCHKLAANSWAHTVLYTSLRTVADSQAGNLDIALGSSGAFAQYRLISRVSRLVAKVIERGLGDEDQAHERDKTTISSRRRLSLPVCMHMFSCEARLFVRRIAGRSQGNVLIKCYCCNVRVPTSSLQHCRECRRARGCWSLALLYGSD